MHNLDYYVAAFELLDDWDQRYEYLVEIGEQLPPMPEQLKIEDNRVKACMSKVWTHVSAGPDGKVQIQGDCDTAIIKGVVGLLINLCNGLTAGEIQRLDMDEIFQRLSLDSHLSPNRHVGVYAMFDLLQKQSLEASGQLAVA